MFFNFCVVDTSDIVGKLKEKIMGDLKEEGLDLSNPEELKRQILEEMKVSYGVERKYQIQLHTKLYLGLDFFKSSIRCKTIFFIYLLSLNTILAVFFSLSRRSGLFNAIVQNKSLLLHLQYSK